MLISGDASSSAVLADSELMTGLRVPMVVLLLVSVGVVWSQSDALKKAVLKAEYWNIKFDEVVDLRNHPTHPVLEEVDSIHSRCVVVILGGSFSRNHCSLCGYEKTANPFVKGKVGRE